MKSQTILFFTLFYLTTYLGISYLISYAWSLEISFIELLTIGLVFSIFLVFLLVFDVPENFVKKFRRKEPVIVYSTNETKDNDDDNVGELLEILDKDNKIGGESNESKI